MEQYHAEYLHALQNSPQFGVKDHLILARTPFAGSRKSHKHTNKANLTV
jgi:hypothetical protein